MRIRIAKKMLSRLFDPNKPPWESTPYSKDQWLKALMRSNCKMREAVRAHRRTKWISKKTNAWLDRYNGDGVMARHNSRVR